MSRISPLRTELRLLQVICEITIYLSHFKRKVNLNTTTTMSSVLIIGSGGVGTMAAYALDSSKKAKVTVVIRSDYDVVMEKGFLITSVDYGNIESYKPTHVVKSVEDAAEFGPFDYVVVTTKNTPDIFTVEDLIAQVVTPKKTAVVLLQNGIEIGASVIARFPENPVLSGVSMISSTNYSGVIDHEGHDFVKVGYFNNPALTEAFQKEAATAFVDLYHNGKNECVYDEDVKFTRWRKLVYNATLNSVCTLTGVDVGRLELFGGVDSIVRSAMLEVLAIAKSDGVDLPEDIMEFMIRSDDGVYYSPSMLVDIRKGNYIELEVICGNAVRIAQKNGVAAPILTLVYDLLKVLQKRTMESKGFISVPKERPVGGTLM